MLTDVIVGDAVEILERHEAVAIVGLGDFIAKAGGVEQLLLDADVVLRIDEILEHLREGERGIVGARAEIIEGLPQRGVGRLDVEIGRAALKEGIGNGKAGGPAVVLQREVLIAPRGVGGCGDRGYQPLLAMVMPAAAASTSALCWKKEGVRSASW